MSADALRRASGRLADAASGAGGLEGATAGLRAFAEVAEALETPSPAAWQAADEDTRSAWVSALEQTAEAALFLLGAIPGGQAEIRTVELELDRQRFERESLAAQREELAGRLGRLDAGAAELREEVTLLQALSALAELRERIETSGTSVQARMAANRRLAEHSKADADELARIDAEICQLDARRESLLLKAIERDEELWQGLLARTV